MNQKHNHELITNIINRYNQGHSVTLLSAEHDIPRSTIYFWLKRHQKLKSTTGTDISYQDYYNLKRRAERLDEKLNIIKAAACSLSVPLQEKLEALTYMDSIASMPFATHLRYPVGHSIIMSCVGRELLTMTCGVKSFESKSKSYLMRGKQRFGSRKICAVLAERGISTSPNYVAGLMQEMGLESVGRHSKREYRKQGGRTRRQNILQQQFNVAEPNHVYAKLKSPPSPNEK
jgi:transposase-like protein